MSSEEYGGIAPLGNGIDQRLSEGCRLEFVGDGRREYVPWRCLVDGGDAVVVWIVGACHWLRRGGVEPSVADDAMIVGRGTGHERGDGIRAVDGHVGVGKVCVDGALLHEFSETVCSEVWRVGLNVSRGQLVDGDDYDEAGFGKGNDGGEAQ